MGFFKRSDRSDEVDEADVDLDDDGDADLDVGDGDERALDESEA